MLAQRAAPQAATQLKQAEKNSHRNARQRILPKTTTTFISRRAVIKVSPTHSGKLASDLNSSTATTFFVIEYLPCRVETAYTHIKDPR